MPARVEIHCPILGKPCLFQGLSCFDVDSRTGAGWVGAKRKPNKIHKFSEKYWVFTSFQPKLRLLHKHQAVDSLLRGNDGILALY